MGLLRAVGFFHGSMFLFSVMVGSGIFLSPKGVLKYSSLNIPVSLGIWGIAALLKMMNAVCLAELATTFPVSAAPYYFLKRSLGSSFAFLNLWINIFGYSLGISAQSLLIAGCLLQPFYLGCQAPELPKKCLALAVLWSLGFLNARGVITVSWFNTISSLMKMVVLCFICITGVVLLVIGKRENISRFENALDAELPDASQIAEAILQASFAYSGSSLLLVLAGEVKNPAKTIPKSFIFGMSTVAVLYILTNASYLAVLSPQEIISSDSVAGTWMNKVFPSMQWVITLLISVSLINNTACGILSASRIFYTASQEGQLPFIFSMLNNHHCPVAAISKIIIFSSIAVIPSSLVNLIKYLMLSSFVLTELYMIALLKLRYQEPHLHRPYKVWSPLIFGSMSTSLFLIVLPMIKTPTMELIYQAIFFLSGFLCYWLHTYLNQRYGFFDKITCYLQLLFNVSPTEKSDSIFMQ
ncbi:solute carrier family 7 member 13 [Phodopus roborovskii]|uniref:Slc7a12 protein n=1 Tax=Phodopus roborovskii TaxID=109678 RepID=A0AAU9YSD9_PHORO|nr:solute carrier family 7 member 13 [Phodopus roborovskii]CAH6777271.1 Slc7a12 [Phodopus roborovskii]